MTEVDEEAVVHIRVRVIKEVMIGKEVTEKIETIRETLSRDAVRFFWEQVRGAR